jgi:hypothetical protein
MPHCNFVSERHLSGCVCRLRTSATSSSHALQARGHRPPCRESGMPKDEQADGWEHEKSQRALSSQPGAHGAGDGGIHFARGARQLGVLTA